MNRSTTARARAAAFLIPLILFAGVAREVIAQPAPPAPAPVQTASAGAANLNITPRRIVFDRTKKSDTVYVFNQGNATATFDITMVDRLMLPSGEIMPVGDAPSRGKLAVELAGKVRSAKDLLIVSPSRLTLEPGKGKTIRIRASAPDTTESSEYRTHLTVTTVPPRSTGLTAEAAAAARPNELVFNVQSIFGLSIPLIVRTGNLTSSASIGGMRIDHDKLSSDGAAPPRSVPVLVVQIDRSGDKSLYGNIEVRAGTGRAGQPIGVVRGVGIYTEITQREVRIPLTSEPKHGETLSVAFIDDEMKAGTEITHGTFSVP